MSDSSWEWWFNRSMSDDVSLVLAYIEASQRARASQRPEDFASHAGLPGRRH